MNSLLVYEMSTIVNSIGYVYIELLYSESIFETIAHIKYSTEWKRLVLILHQGMDNNNHLRIYSLHYE